MKCFVIQPFDGSKYDARYTDVFRPAIEAARCTPDRVDKDPAADVPIERIEAGIRESEMCFAEISTNNANVWFEVGFAIACGKPVCLVCSDERTEGFPFDVRHRKIIEYKTRSTSDYTELGGKITERLKAIAASIARQPAPVPQIQSVGLRSGLPDHEVAALGAISVFSLENSFSMSGLRVAQVLGEEAGFTRIAAFLAVEGLQQKGLITPLQEEDYQGESFIGYRPSPSGTQWLLENQAVLSLRFQPPAPRDPNEIPF